MLNKKDLIKTYIQDCEIAMKRFEKLCSYYHNHDVENDADKCEFYQDYAFFENRQHELLNLELN